MPKSPDSPISQFLKEKENLPAVLEVIRYAEEIRDYVANGFWDRLVDTIKKHPKALSASFSWARVLADKSDGYFKLIARPQGLSEKAQGLPYTIETHPENIGVGLNWNEVVKAAGQIEKLCQLQSLKALQAELLKRRVGDIDPKPNPWTFWWEYWQRDPYADPWSWFGEHLLDDAFFNGLAEKFWDFVLPIHQLVLEANKSLSQSRS